MRLSLFFKSLTLISAVAPTLRAADPAPSDPPAALTPTMQKAITNLSAEDFHDRQKALRQVKESMAREAVAMTSETDAGTRANLVEALEFDDGLIRWVEHFLSTTADDQAAELKLISHPDALPVLSKIFAPWATERVDGVKELAKLDLPGADGLLARMIDDENRAVEVTAMDTAWDLKPTTAIVDALWKRAVLAGVPHKSGESGIVQTPVTFRSRPIRGIYDPTAYAHFVDGDLAAEVLIHYNTPLLKDRMIAFFNEAAKTVSQPDVTETEILAYSSSYPSIHNAYTLLQSYKPPELIPSLYALGTCRPVQKATYPSKQGKCTATNRTAALALLVLMTNQRLEDYQLTQQDQGEMGILWLCTADEDASVMKMREWWEKNGQQYTK